MNVNFEKHLTAKNQLCIKQQRKHNSQIKYLLNNLIIYDLKFWFRTWSKSTEHIWNHDHHATSIEVVFNERRDLNMYIVLNSLYEVRSINISNTVNWFKTNSLWYLEPDIQIKPKVVLFNNTILLKYSCGYDVAYMQLYQQWCQQRQTVTQSKKY